MADAQLTDEVVDVLRRSRVEGNNLFLPPQQLDRKLYEAVNKALTNMGGKWVTKVKAHVFNSDPTTKLQQALGTGIATDERKLYQAFYTPPALAVRLADMADVMGKRVLEPSAGRGAIAVACRNVGASEVVCVEINSESAAHLLGLRFVTVNDDFLSLHPQPCFDRVVMNPPFTGNQDIAHVEQALKWLRPGGVLVAVMMGNRERPRFQRLISSLDYDIEELPRDTFKQSGATAASLILTVRVSQ